MTLSAGDTTVASEAVIRAGSMTPADLAELMGAFNEVTSKLEATHVQLRAEVARLNQELRRANEQLHRSRRLAALGEMAAGIAHEVRNPLGSIRLYAKMLEDDLAHMPEQQETAVKIAGAVRRLDAVVTDVLAFSREMRPRMRPVEASEVLTAAVESCRSSTRIEVVRPDLARHGAPVVLDADEGLLRQALINVVRNAIEAMADDPRTLEPRLTLDARRTRMVGEDGADEGPGVVLAIADEGPGIPAAVVERVFNPFFTTRATGTGLGLAIVHRIVDAHGGRVVVRQNGEGAGGGRGTTVELHFPVVCAAERREDRAPALAGAESTEANG